MQRKITKPIEEGANLPELTDQQQKFVSGLLAGKKASDAYREAYDCSNMKPTTIWAAASKLRADYRVATWLASARKAGLGAAVVTLEGHLNELERLREIALETGNVGAAVQAEQLRGKAQGHYVEKLEMTVHDPMDMLREIASISPALAKQVADENGIEWQETTQH